jgi:hypothetical protein
MKYDLSVVGGGIIAVGFIAWIFWGTPRVHSVQPLDSDLKLVSERSPYMRTER